MHHVNGDFVSLRTTNRRHYGAMPAASAPGDFMARFSEAVQNSVKDTNDLQVTSDRLATQMMRRPDTVNVHDVMIAAQKAQLSLDYTRQILTKAVRAYQSITSLQ